MKKIISFLLILSIAFSFCFSATESNSKVDEKNDDTPQWLKDTRRTEIITLGALPFATMLTTLCYQSYRYVKNDFNRDYFPNPLAKSSSAANLNEYEQIGVFVSAACLSLGVGLTDLIINIVIRNKQKKINKQAAEIENVKISEIERPLPKIKTEPCMPNEIENENSENKEANENENENEIEFKADVQQGEN